MSSNKERLLNCIQPRYKSQSKIKGAYVIVGVRDSQKTLLKDQNFFRDKTWDNSYIFSNKLFKHFHQDSIQKNKKLDSRNYKANSQLQEEANRMKEERLSMTKSQLKDFYDSSVKQRSSLQIKSGQKVFKTKPILQTKDIEKNIVSVKYPPAFFATPKEGKNFSSNFQRPNSKIFRMRSDNIWNQFSDLSKKHVTNLVPEGVLRLDETAFETIKSRMDKEQENFQMIIQAKKLTHDKIRNKKALNSFQDTSHQILHSLVSPQTPNTNASIEPGKIDFDSQHLMGLYVNDVNRITPKQNSEFSQWIKSRSKLVQSNHPERKMSSQEIKPILKKSKDFPNAKFNTETGDEKDEIRQLEVFDQNMKLHKRIMLNTRYPRIQLHNMRKLAF